ncbi:unnamed protein product [Protopolystoma xenopodis]|uniref:Uncharacterized protein n=1 Tax=Protopolystoma xenopodis TaxID=117903 RepID=A0A448WLW9_9PLAT|nr:unnamed protein product [Protopolystoma xenopodis]
MLTSGYPPTGVVPGNQVSAGSAFSHQGHPPPHPAVAAFLSQASGHHSVSAAAAAAASAAFISAQQSLSSVLGGGNGARNEHTCSGPNASLNNNGNTVGGDGNHVIGSNNGQGGYPAHGLMNNLALQSDAFRLSGSGLGTPHHPHAQHSGPALAALLQQPPHLQPRFGTAPLEFS